MSACLTDGSSTNDYIQRWLTKMVCGSPRKSDPDTITRPKTRTYEHHRNKVSERIDPVNLTISPHPVDTRTNQSSFKNDHTMRHNVDTSHRPRQLSRGSSCSRHVDKGTGQRDTNNSDNWSTGREVTQSKAVPKIADPSAKYEKRARYKAKPDKYEYKGEIEVKKKPRNRKRKRTGPDLVGNEDFHAENVDVERVTLKPNCEQYVFSQSKMSVPLAGHDLPDLTFTKMDFLSRPQPSTNQGSTKVPVKHDKKDGNHKRNGRLLVMSDTANKAHQSQHVSSKSDLCSERRSGPASQSSLVRVSRSNGRMTTISSRKIEKPTWVRSQIDSRLEEYQAPHTSTGSSSPVPWSTSPPARHSTHTVTIPWSHQQAESEKVHACNKAQTDQAQDRASSDICDDLTQSLLHRRTRSDTKSWHQNILKRFQSLEDLKSISDQIFGKQSSDGPLLMRPSPHHNRPHIRLMGPMEADLVHEPPTLYTGDVTERQYDQTPSTFPHTARQWPIQDHEPIHYNSDFIPPNSRVSYATEELSHTAHNDLVELPRSPAIARRNRHQQDPVIQYVDGNLAWVEAAEPGHGGYTFNQDMMYPRWTDERELDDFDLELLKAAKIDTTEQRHLRIGNFRQSNQEGGSWLRPYCAKADLSYATLSPPTLKAANRLAKNDQASTHEETQVLAINQGLVIDRPSLQHKTPSAFNPFRHSWMLV